MRVVPGQGPHLCSALPPDAPRNAVLSTSWDSRTTLVAVLQCTVDSEPPAELTLSLDGEVLATSHGANGSATGLGRVQVARNALWLHVQNTTAGDGGTYVCTARNLLGSASTTGQLQASGEWAGPKAGPS